MTTQTDAERALALEARRVAFEAELGEPITLDALTGDYVMYQRRNGHRYSTDDLLTAWYATVHGAAHRDASAPPPRLCDLGTGIGSVGLTVAWFFAESPLTAIEVQDVSFRFFGENVRANGVESRVRAIHGDLREEAEKLAPESFDLVTGSPPYFPLGAGTVSSDSQRAGARFELRGDVRDYCRAARRLVAPGGRFVFCFPTVQRARAEDACKVHQLPIVASCDVIPRVTLPALFTLFACARDDDEARPPRAPDATHAVRDESGAPTAAHVAARARLGLGPRHRFRLSD